LERILLYYPAINIPNGKWVRDSILYTDKVASIFPFQDIKNPNVNDDIRELFDEGQYEPFYVLKELESQKGSSLLTDFENNFLSIIKSKEFKKVRRNLKTQEKNKNFMQNEYEIYIQKLTNRTVEFLKNNKLFLEVNSKEVIVDKVTATVYLSMLANFLSNVNSNVVIPSTDNPEFERIAFQLADTKIPTNQIIIKNCLPTPSPNVSLKKIIKFKKKRNQELQKFRKEIDKIEEEIVSSDNQEDRKLKMVQFKENYEIEVKDLKKLYGDSNIELVWNSFNSLLDFKEKDLSGLKGSLTGLGLISSHPFTGIPGIVAGSIALVVTGINTYKKTKRKIESNSYSYLYYAEKSGVV